MENPSAPSGFGDQAPVPSTRWGTVLLLFCSGVVAAFQVGKAPAALPLIRVELGLSLFTASWVLSIFGLIGASSGMVTGAVADWLGHRRLALSGLGLVVLGSVAGAVSLDARMLLISRFIEGFGFLVISASAPAMIARIAHPADLRLAIGVWSAYMPSGTAAMMLVSPLLLASVGWRGLWLTNAIIGALFAVLLLVLTRGEAGATSLRTAGPPRPWGSVKAIVSQPGPALLAGSFLLYAMQFMSLMGFLPTFFMEERAMDQGRAAVLTAIAIAMNIPGNLSGGWLLHRGLPRWALLASSFVVSSLCTVGVYSSAVPDGVRYILCLVFSSVGGIVPAVLLAGAPVHASRPELVATTNGFIMQGSNFGTLVGPPILAAIVTSTGSWRSAPWLFLISTVVALLLSLRIRALEREKAQHDHLDGTMRGV